MFDIWIAFFVMICIVVVVFIPAATLYYEEDDSELLEKEKKSSHLWTVICQESILLFAFLLLLLALYFTNSGSDLPVQAVNVAEINLEELTYNQAIVGSSPYEFLNQTYPTKFLELTTTITSQSNLTHVATNHTLYQDTTMFMPISFPVYLIGLFGWLSWWMFALFVGVGLSANPFDLIVAYIWRPRILPPDVMANKELELQERTKDILEITTLLRRERNTLLSENSRQARSALSKRYLTDRMEVNRLTQMVFLLERDIEDYKLCKNIRQSYNPLLPYMYLAMGIGSVIISLLWIIQIILYLIIQPPAHPFLNAYLLSFNSWFPMFGNITYAIFSLYLLICTIKGCFKLSMRALCIKIHPMKVGGTLVNAFLFNLGIVLCCTVPLINFCVAAFSSYAIDTDVYLIFIVQANHLRFFVTFFENHVFIWMILLIALGLVPYFFYAPRDAPPSTEDFRRKLSDRSHSHAHVAYSPLRSKGKEVEMK